jgi:hypothetical protein
VVLNAFLKIPYREDGAVNENGDYVLWANPQRTFSSPGFNCSGFLVSAARFILKKNFTLEESKRDFLGDSGPGSPFGEDWDFGLDIIVNLAGPGAILFPYLGEEARIEDEKGKVLGLGANIHSPDFKNILYSLNPGKIYFFAISKPDSRFKGGISYYHNGIIIPGQKGELWFYHSTRKGGVNRANLKSDQGYQNFLAWYPRTRGRGERRIVFIEAADYPREPLH